MEPLVLMLLALGGGAAGLAAMALPGVHVNALALAALAFAPGAGEGGVAFLLGALAGAPFGLALSSTFLHADADLPAPALAREGRGAEAVALQAWGAFAGLALAVPLALFARPAFDALLAPRLGDIIPWLLLAILVLLVATERARPAVRRAWVVVPAGSRPRRGRGADAPSAWSGREARGAWDGERIGKLRVTDPYGLLPRPLQHARPRDDDANREEVSAQVEAVWREGPLSPLAGRGLALVALALSGALGLVALRMGAASPAGLPASALLPLLAGLFAAPGLLALLVTRSRPARAKLRAPRPPRGELLRAAAPGAAASVLLGIAPGVAPSHVALLTSKETEPERRLIRAGAINGGAVVFALLAWHALGKARQGALVAAQAYAGPSRFVEQLALVVAAAGVACLLARALSRPISRAAAATSPRSWGAGGLALLVSIVAFANGAWGLAVLVVSALVGLVIAAMGVRRGLAMGCILVPVALRAWGLA